MFEADLSVAALRYSLPWHLQAAFARASSVVEREEEEDEEKQKEKEMRKRRECKGGEGNGI